jgi:hypothetical protein
MQKQVKAVSLLPAPGVMTIEAGQFGLLGAASSMCGGMPNGPRRSSKSRCRSRAQSPLREAHWGMRRPRRHGAKLV